jgi:hypothetical protein
MLANLLFLLCLSLLSTHTHGFRLPRRTPTVTPRSSSTTRLYSSPPTTTSNDIGQRVGIVGAGAIALGTAALLHQAHHQAMLWSPSGRPLEPEFTQTGAVPDSTFSCPSKNWPNKTPFFYWHSPPMATNPSSMPLHPI